MEKKRIEAIVVWLCRIISGGAFIFSGFAKGVDPWGTIFKLEQYLENWDLSLPRSLLLIVALFLSIGEFVLGTALLSGIYRRIAPRISLVVISFFLMLTLYIAIKSPVADCGCFGDAWVLSNWATFFKNVVLFGLLFYLVKFNDKVNGLFNKMQQWIVAIVALFYVLCLAIIGYVVQPVVDFRPYKEGRAILPDIQPKILFVYEKDGVKQEFDAEHLPSSDSGWEYIGRKETQPEVMPIIIENEEEEDITEDVLIDNGNLLLFVVPEIKNANISTTMYLNRIAAIASMDDVEVVTLLGADSPTAIYLWKDISMTSSPVYISDAVSLKTLVRGETALVLVQNGLIEHKLSMSIISNGRVTELENGDITLQEFMTFPGKEWLTWSTLIIACVLLVLVIWRIFLRDNDEKDGTKNKTDRE